MVFQPMCGTLSPAAAASFTTRPAQQPQALAAVSLVARLEEQLVPEADAEHRALAPRDVTHRSAESGLLQRTRSDRERADARKHHTVARHDHVRIRADHRFGARDAKRALDAAQIADAVVADCRPRALTTSLSSTGTPPPMTRNASRVARPSALNAASAM